MLDRKEALLTQLRTMNDEAEAGMHVGPLGRHTQAFQAAYAKVVLELKQASSSTLCLITSFLAHHLIRILILFCEPQVPCTGPCTTSKLSSCVES